MNHAVKRAENPKKDATEGAFLSDVVELRRRARREIEEGAVTPGYRARPRTTSSSS